MLGGLFREGRSISSVPWQQHPDSGWGVWQGDGGSSWAGVPVDEKTAVQLMTVYGCVRLISDQISTLPVDVFRDAGGVSAEVAAPRWLLTPTADLSWTDWCTQVLWSLLLDGNAYVAVMRDAGAQIVELVPLDPSKVQVFRRSPGDRKRYKVNGAEVPGLEVLHIKGIMQAGSDVGLSPLDAARQSIGVGLAAQKYGAEFFTGEGNMPGVIEAPGEMQPATMRDLAQQWRKKRTSGGRGLPGVLQGGATWKPSGVTNEQAQFLQTRQYTAAEIAGQMFLVDPSDLGIPVQGTSLTYANLEQRNIRRLQVTLLPWIVRIESAVSGLLARPRFVKLNVNGLLRADLKSRYESYKIGIDAKFLVPNEPRGWEDLAPLPEGDTPIQGGANDNAAA